MPYYPVAAELQNISKYAIRKANTHLWGVIQTTSMKYVKQIKVQFDPFHEHAKQTRDFYFHMTSPKLRQTGSYGVKLDVKSDRSDPLIQLKYNDGTKVIFKSRHLSTYDILMQMRKIHEQREIAAETKK